MVRRLLVVLVAALFTPLALVAPPRAGAAEVLPALPRGRLPLAGSPRVVRPYAPPPRKWLRGHRGVDLAGRVGAPVLAAADGQIAYAGVLAGRGVVVVQHGALRTTYEPVTTSLPVGTPVRAGQPIGTLDGGHACRDPLVEACLHWGLKLGDDYLDPMLMVGGGAGVRLLPADAAAEAVKRATQRAAEPVPSVPPGVGGPYRRGGHGSVIPGGGPVTSPFGMRRHPVLGVWKLHDGVDFGTGCGQPLRAVHDGVVEASYFNGGYGNRLMLDHGTVDGHRVKSSYNHAIRYTVAPGARVAKGQVIGLSGSTGYSTGCHLHFMMWIDGRLIDPMTWLG
ncbi:M23 family metallopeptidase [Mariniluteicoccus flavus]